MSLRERTVGLLTSALLTSLMGFQFSFLPYKLWWTMSGDLVGFSRSFPRDSKARKDKLTGLSFLGEEEEDPLLLFSVVLTSDGDLTVDIRSTNCLLKSKNFENVPTSGVKINSPMKSQSNQIKSWLLRTY